MEVLDLLYLHHMGRCDVLVGGLWSGPSILFWILLGLIWGVGWGFVSFELGTRLE
jgi:hypothetical protein